MDPRERGKNADAVAPRSRISGTCVRKFVGFCCWFGFVSEYPGDDSGNLNFKVAATRASRDFLEKTRCPHGGPGGARFQVGAGRPRRARPTDARPTRARRGGTQPVPRPKLALGGWKKARAGSARKFSAGPVRPPPGLQPRDPPGSSAATAGAMPRVSRPQLVPSPGGQVLAPQGPRSRPRAALDSRPRRRAPRKRPAAAAPHSPPLAPPVEPGGLSRQRRRAGRGGGGGGAWARGAGPAAGASGFSPPPRAAGTSAWAPTGPPPPALARGPEPPREAAYPPDSALPLHLSGFPLSRLHP